MKHNRVNAMRLAMLFATRVEALVEKVFACPTCGERRMDHLIISEFNGEVNCATCGTSYDLD